MEPVIEKILSEVKKVIIGKDEILEKILMAFISQGHVLLDDVPGTGKMYIHGADTDGSDSTTDQAERTELQDRFRRSMCSEKTGGKPEEYPQLCGFCTDI